MLLALGAAAPAPATIVNGGCLEEESPEGLNCTSNDVTFILVGLGTQTDGCVDEGYGFCTDVGDPDPDPDGASCSVELNNCPAGQECRARDEIDIFLRAIVQNSTAQTRYDIGMWFSTDGDPNGDGALSGECGREMLHPTRACLGGANDGFPCDFDSECPGGACLIPLIDGEAAQTCPPLDLLGDDPFPDNPDPQGDADGPYLVAESTPEVYDRCGDLFAQGNSGCDEDPDGLWDDSIVDFQDPVTLPCSDVDADGFINIPTCATWGQQEVEISLGTCVGGADAGDPCTASNQCTGGTCMPRGVCVGGANQGLSCLADADCPSGDCQGNSFAIDTCDSEYELFNGTPAKCRCEAVESNIPAPNLDLTCTPVNRCSESPAVVCEDDTDCTFSPTDVCVTPPATFPPESQWLYDISFANTVVCTDPVPPNPDERFRCGTASFIRFDVDDQLLPADPDNGIFEGATDLDTGATPSVTAEEVRWIPNSELGTPGIIGPDYSGTMRVSYRIGAGTETGDTITLRARTFWSNEADFDPGVYQALTATCPINVEQVWASVAGVTAYERDGRVTLEWRTTSEVGTRGFEVYRLERGARLPLSAGLVASPMRSDGAIYRVADPHAFAGDTARYLLVEEDFYGQRRALGPYEVRVAAAQPAAGLAQRPVLDDLAAADQALPATAELARLAAAHGEAAAAKASRAVLGSGSLALKANVATDGIQRLTAAQLAAGWGLSTGQVQSLIGTGRIRIANRGEEIAWGREADNSAIYFYGRAAADPYSPFNVYWIEATFGTPAGTVASNATPAPGGTFVERLRLEQNALAATNSALNPDVDFWFWKGIQAGGAPGVFDVEVPDVAAGAAELTVRLYSASDYPMPQEHTAIVRLNGTEVGATTWEDIRFHEATLPVPGGVLADGANQIEVVGFLADGVPFSGFFVDSFTVTYPRYYRAQDDALAFRADSGAAITVEGFSSADILLFEVTDPLAPRQVTGALVDPDGAGGFRVSFTPDAEASYYAVTRAAVAQPAALWLDKPSDLRGAAGASWLAIAPSHLVASTANLAAHRSRTLSAMVVDVEDVYDEFNYGLASPKALRDFLAWAWANWSEAPRYALLIGAGSFDYKDYRGFGDNFMPPLLVHTPSGLFASDLALGDVDRDGLPEVMVGRFPALTANEVDLYVRKLKTLERGAGPDWRGSVLVVADDPDEAGDFTRIADTVVARFRSPYFVEAAYLEQQSPAEVRQLMLDRLNAGVGLLDYIGHGGVSQFADEALLTTADVALLTNARRLPIIASLSCATGRFEFPANASLAEALLVAPNGGAAAVWAPSGLSYSVDAGKLNRAFADALMDGGLTLGEAVHAAFVGYEAEGYFRHLLAIYNIFGDPAMPAR